MKQGSKLGRGTEKQTKTIPLGLKDVVKELGDSATQELTSRIEEKIRIKKSGARARHR